MRFTNTLLPALGLAIMLGEAGITYAGMFHPQVDQYYADYFITHTRSCWVPNAAAANADDAALNINNITVSELTPASACYFLRSGWSGVEPWGVWSDGAIAELQFPIQPRKSTIILHLTGFSPQNRQVVTIFADNTRIGKYFVPDNRILALPVAVPPGTAGDLVIKFLIKHPTQPGQSNSSADSRQLGIGLVSIDWQ